MCSFAFRVFFSDSLSMCVLSPIFPTFSIYFTSLTICWFWFDVVFLTIYFNIFHIFSKCFCRFSGDFFVALSHHRPFINNPIHKCIWVRTGAFLTVVETKENQNKHVPIRLLDCRTWSNLNYWLRVYYETRNARSLLELLNNNKQQIDKCDWII